MERDHQERDRVHGFYGVKADSTAFHPISGSKGDSVSKTLVLRHKKVRLGTLKHIHIHTYIYIYIYVVKMRLVQSSSALERTWKRRMK